MLFPNI